MTRIEEIEQAAENYYNEVKILSDLSAFPIAAFKAGAKWADKTMLDKVCKWLDKYMCNKSNGIKVKDYQFVGELIYNLRKAMEV